MATYETAEAQSATRRFVKQAMKAPLLEHDYERALAIKWRDQQDERALHELTTAYMRLVISMAARFRNYGLPMSDLVQEGNIGLMQAAARFEPERDVRFSTYAAWWIRSSIQDYVLRNWSIVRTGTTAAQKSLFFNLRRLRALISDTGEGMISRENRDIIATKLGVSEREVEQMAARLSANDRSLNAPMSEGLDGGGEWQDLLADEGMLPEQDVMERTDTERRVNWIQEALKSLNPRELVIIQERRLTDDGMTLEALGVRMGISKERVRQIEHQALKKLRAALIKKVGDPEASGLLPDV
ncbi:RNA polymerase sigma factor RpoH [Candidatus Phycosocius bacilliformis]|uniref:RNA polymerase sigma factor RpoH n=1 Tax=Candidatus Phycosocius bacilliformis TaxID=1445552 RepID=A0A2P2E5Z9_9PROT|nr:RNA polymerase factor sigma-32 [Candidatus Phycosocius bacilliformis]GBF56491.1 RNA polymerase sigma factor RpoH [Candidatus Phycosocius bacilliformis]